MTTRTYVKVVLLSGLVSLSLGALLLHLRIHPLDQGAANFVPFIACILSIVVVPLLFSSKRFVEYGYVLNGMLVIVGTITMSHFSFAHWPVPTTFGTILFRTTLQDVLILWGNFFVGKALFDLEFHGYDPGQEKRGKTYRWPNLGWWIVHLATLSVVYFIGHTLWR